MYERCEGYGGEDRDTQKGEITESAEGKCQRDGGERMKIKRQKKTMVCVDAGSKRKDGKEEMKELKGKG